MISYQENRDIRNSDRNARKHGKTAVKIPDKKAVKPPSEKNISVKKQKMIPDNSA